MEVEKPYKRPSIAGWLLPTMIGPFLAMALGVSLYAWVGPLHDLIPRSVFLVVGLLVGSLWALMYSIVTSLVDLALLAVRVRTLPNGKHAWLASFAAPLSALATYAVYSPHKWYKFGPWAIVGAVLLPLLITSVGSRVLGGRKP